MNFRDWFLRTFVPILAGLIITFGVKHAIAIDGATATMIATSAVTVIYAMLARLVEVWKPKAGVWLTSLNLATKSPAYMNMSEIESAAEAAIGNLLQPVLAGLAADREQAMTSAPAPGPVASFISRGLDEAETVAAAAAAAGQAPSPAELPGPAPSGTLPPAGTGPLPPDAGFGPLPPDAGMGPEG